MKKFGNYVWMVLCLCMIATVVTAQRKVKTVAEKVTLFIDGAQVTRTERVEIPGIHLYCLLGFRLISMPVVCR